MAPSTTVQSQAIVTLIEPSGSMIASVFQVEVDIFPVLTGRQPDHGGTVPEM